MRGKQQLQLQLTRTAVVVLAAMAMAAAVAGAGAISAELDEGWGYCDAATGQCGGFIMGEEEEEMSRRMLVATLGGRYISYGALSRDRVPCSQAGRSYYNCRGSGPANPYSRGCSRITHCYRDVS